MKKELKVEWLEIEEMVAELRAKDLFKIMLLKDRCTYHDLARWIKGTESEHLAIKMNNFRKVVELTLSTKMTVI